MEDYKDDSARSGTNVSNNNIVMNFQAGESHQELAMALLKQAEANITNSKAIRQLAKSLIPTKSHAINIARGEA